MFLLFVYKLRSLPFQERELESLIPHSTRLKAQGIMMISMLALDVDTPDLKFSELKRQVVSPTH